MSGINLASLNAITVMKNPTFSITTVLLILCAMLSASCEYHDVDPEGWKMKYDTPCVQRMKESVRTSEKAGATFFLDSAILVNVMARVADDGGQRYLVETAEGYRYIINKGIDSPSVLRCVDWQYHHYMKEQSVEGRMLSDIRREWGEYMLMDKSMRNHSGRVVAYPQINMMYGGKYLRGVTLDTDSTGRITHMLSFDGVQSNLFGKLPFFDDIMALNLLEYIQPAFYIDSPEQGREEQRGVIAPLFSGIVAYAIYSLPIILLALIIFPLMRASVLSVCLYLPVYIPYTYVSMLVMLNEYHSAWMLLIIVFTFISLMPAVVYGLSAMNEADRCTRCKANKWKKEEERDMARQVEYEPYPTMMLGYDSNGRISLDRCKITRIRRWHIPVRVKCTCMKCGNVKYKYTTELRQSRDSCIKCGKRDIPYHFENIRINGLHITGKYVENCPSCGHELRSNIDMYGQVQQRPVSAPKKKASEEPSGRKVNRIPANCRNFSHGITGENKCNWLNKHFENPYNCEGICGTCSGFEKREWISETY